MKPDAALDELLGALLFLMSRQARFPGMNLSPAIREHLLWLADHPDQALGRVRHTSRRLAEQWASVNPTPADGRVKQAQAERTLH
jgi:hypothetical protein